MIKINTPERLTGYLRKYAELYPGAWKAFEYFRRGKEILGGWPDWCWCPLGASYAIVGHGENISFDKVPDVSTLGALATWRITQGIYRFDSDLFKSLWETELEERLPIDVFFRLPEWCVYIEVPEGYDWWGYKLYGFFAHLEYDVNARRPELRLVLDTEHGFSMLILHLSSPTINECIKSVWEEGEKNTGFKPSEDVLPQAKSALVPYISVVLYLCSQAADIYDLQGKKEKPGNPRPQKTKKGMRIFPVSEKTTWMVGYRIGAALRRAHQERDKKSAEGTHASPRPHVRRAHWHSYWTGPKDGKRKVILKWLPPILVGGDEIIPTIRAVD